MAAGTLSYHVGLNKLLRGGGGDDDDDDEEFGCCHRAALGVVGGFCWCGRRRHNGPPGYDWHHHTRCLHD